MKAGSRITTLLLAGLFSSAALAVVDAAAIIDTDTAIQEWRFKVYLDDKEIGYHHFFLTQKGEAETVSSKAKFDVSYFSIPFFKYRHENTEQWEGACLKRIISTTDQNGKRFRLEGAQQDGLLKLSTQDGDKTLPGCVSTFAYWDKAFLSRKQLLNSQTGDHIDVDIRYLGEQNLPAKDADSSAHHYQIIAENVDIQLWYSNDNQWLALQSTTTSGRVLRYVNE